MAIDWSKAPEGAQYYANKAYWKSNKIACGYLVLVDGVWLNAESTVTFSHSPFFYNDVQSKADHIVESNKKVWPETDERISAIAQNGNTGEHYPSTKHDSDKPRYDLLPPIAIDLMAQVMTFGAKKYKPEGWRTVDNAIQRYQAALLRHSFAMLRGEVLDPESGLPHAAHVMCCAAFIAELQGKK